MASRTEPLLDIAEVAERTGVAPSALRYWERLGLLDPAGRNGLRRTYEPAAVDRVALILSGQAVGFSLAEVDQLVHARPAALRARLAEKADELGRQIATLEAMREQLGHALTCEHRRPLDCPTFRAGLRQVLPGDGR